MAQRLRLTQLIWDLFNQSFLLELKLLAVLTSEDGHQGVRLGPDSMNRLVTWMDTYAQRLGSFSERQEEQLRELRRKMAHLLAE